MSNIYPLPDRRKTSNFKQLLANEFKNPLTRPGKWIGLNGSLFIVSVPLVVGVICLLVALQRPELFENPLGLSPINWISLLIFIPFYGAAFGLFRAGVVVKGLIGLIVCAFAANMVLWLMFQLAHFMNFI